MKPSIGNVIPVQQLCLTLLGAALFAIPNIAFAQQIDTPMGDTLYTVSGWFTGNVGKGLATIAVAIIGVYALLGRMSWAAAAATGSGIAVIFGAANISYNLMCSGDTACIQAQMVADATDAAAKGAPEQAAAAAAQQASSDAAAAAAAAAAANPTDPNASSDAQSAYAAMTADNDAAAAHNLASSGLMAVDLHNLLVSEGLGDTVAALNAAATAQNDLAQLQTLQGNLAWEVQSAQGGLDAIYDATDDQVLRHEDGAAMDDSTSTRGILSGDWGSAEYGAGAQTTGDSAAAYYNSVIGNTTVANLYAQAYTLNQAEYTADTLAAANPGNTVLYAGALSATLAAENATIAADTAAQNVYAKIVDQTSVDGVTVAQDVFNMQQAVNGMK